MRYGQELALDYTIELSSMALSLSTLNGDTDLSVAASVSPSEIILGRLSKPALQKKTRFLANCGSVI